MKLRKALDKAKKQRKEEPVEPVAPPTEEAIAAETSKVAEPTDVSKDADTSAQMAEDAAASGAAEEAEVAETPQPAEKETQKADNGDWKAPVYHQSTQASLDVEAVINNRCVCIEPQAPELDSYKVLRTKIQQLTQDKGWNTVMITSPRAGDGKTLTAINLSLTFSKAYNQTVLLVDCDLRSQSIHKVLGLESHAGLIDYLVDDVPMQDFIIWPGVDKLTLISGGRSIQNSAELLGSPRMKDLVHEMKSRYDDRYVIFDVPPILLGADAMALAPVIDAIVMVVDEGKTTNRDIKKALEMIPQEKFIGFVMNRQSASNDMEGYYGYYS